ncbi:FAD/NAD(P)-binding protein [Candidatus Woesearchaeota archaeon]|nr:FAD/NAD(P)-binding protein [Candidatus Woesearchaeota archaeon]
MAKKPTHIGALKTHGLDSEQNLVAARLREAMEQKGFDRAVLKNLAEQSAFPGFVAEMLLRIQPNGQRNRHFESEVRRAFMPGKIEPDRSATAYIGAPEQNAQIDACIKHSPFYRTLREEELRSLTGEGATTQFTAPHTPLSKLTPRIDRTPVVIIGGGVSGLMVYRALVELGWDARAITVVDKEGKFGGIWNYDMVAEGTRNNPKDLRFLKSKLDTAPGPGEEIADFIFELQHAYPIPLPNPRKGCVTRVEPGDLATKVHYTANGKEHTITAPIVINAIGLGKPKSISREGWMTASATNGQAGYRWQQILGGKEAKKYHGKHVVLIGLGNSTAEMLVQFHQLMENGYDVDYRVLTHYPQESVQFPGDVVLARGREFQVFRDLTIPNLVDYSGDLEDTREAYFEALNAGRIIADVRHWDKKGKWMRMQRHNAEPLELRCDVLYTLIGYGHSREELMSMGVMADEETGAACYDYDGEFQAELGAKGRKRVHAGYFGQGPVLESPENPNAVVIPGVMHRLHDQLLSIVLRACEYESKRA